TSTVPHTPDKNAALVRNYAPLDCLKSSIFPPASAQPDIQEMELVLEAESAIAEVCLSDSGEPLIIGNDDVDHDAETEVDESDSNVEEAEEEEEEEEEEEDVETIDDTQDLLNEEDDTNLQNEGDESDTLDFEAEDLDKMKVKELHEICDQFDISKKGRKREIVYAIKTKLNLL
ncbi:unnamed protein product, partial [marine sediment metagenome]